LFAVVIALMVYSGYPEGVILLGVALGVFLAVLVGFRLFQPGRWGPIGRPVGDLILATVAGAGLSMPLTLPGLQVVAGSSRNGKIGIATQTVGSHFVKNLFIDGFDGLKGGGTPYFGPHTDGSTVMYVGVIAAVLAVVAVAIRWRQPMVLAFAVVSVAMAGLVFVAPLASVIDHLPEVGSVRLYDALGPLALAVAVLAGVGTDVLVSSAKQRAVQYWAGAGFAGVGLVLLALWVFSRGHLPHAEAVTRNISFIWPAIETALGLAVIGVLVALGRRSHRSRNGGDGSWPAIGRYAAAVLLVCETVFLVTAGMPTFSSSPSPLKPTPDDLALHHAVGSSAVGLGTSCTHTQKLGIVLNVNVAFQIQEFADYDPTVPYSYIKAWDAVTRKRIPGSGRSSVAHSWSNVFCPKVATASEARRFGIGFVLEHLGSPGPRGAVFDKRIGNENLYRIPDAAAATLTRLSPDGHLPAMNAKATPVPVTHPNPASWNVVTHATTPQVLRLRLTDLPGWHGTIDGRPLSLTTYGGVMLQARIPSGRHTIELKYWPDTFSVGIVLALVTAIALAIGVIIESVRRGRRGRNSRGSTTDLASSG
jgi:hypothetical protein